ncbi:MAG: thioredoxin-like domain-containing protein [Bacteroidales bacterium]|nr:thioredoxin-like domain-containing protein [Bacteroidales bacterium]
MKYILVVVTVSVVFLFTSFMDKNAKPGIGLSKGESAPLIQTEDFNLQKYSGKKVLVSFWATSDARSRAYNALSHALLTKYSGEIEVVSFNNDSDKVIFSETVKIDNLNPDTQHYLKQGNNDDIIVNYHLKDGLNAFLIDKDGVIIAVNPDFNKLKELSNNF